jgi:soluble lytic murein transglycosylase-like protein
MKSVGIWALGGFAAICSPLLLAYYTPLHFALQKTWEYNAAELESLAHLAAVLHDVDPDIFIAQMRQESNFDQHARSKAGALGVAQIMPETAKSWKVDPANPMQALDAAAKNMAGFIRTYKAQGHDERTAYKMALAAYNAGPGAVAKYGGIPPYPETQAYVKIILADR